MKGIHKQTKIAAFLLGALFLVNPASAQAVETTIRNPLITVENSSTSTVQPRADVIVKKYRTYNGKRQYRRWNETRGYWVDSDWIDMP